MLYRRDIKIKPLKQCITHCSMVSLEMYLCCYIFDKLYYPWFKERFFETQSQFLSWFFVIVPLCFLSSYLTGTAYNSLKDLIQKSVTRIVNRCSLTVVR